MTRKIQTQKKTCIQQHRPDEIIASPISWIVFCSLTLPLLFLRRLEESTGADTENGMHIL
jgi:hypothetical protein